MLYLFNIFLYYPITNILVILYNTLAFGDLGVAILILTIIVRLCLAPMQQKTLQQQAVMQKIKPEIVKIQEQHKDNKEKQTILLLELYKKHQINPFNTFFILLIQLPILLALFRVFTNGLSGNISNIVYPFIYNPGAFNPISMGILDLNQTNIILIILIAIFQFIQIYLSSAMFASDRKALSTSLITGIMISLFSVIVLWNLPSAVAIYWMITILFAIGQQIMCNKLNQCKI